MVNLWDVGKIILNSVADSAHVTEFHVEESRGDIGLSFFDHADDGYDLGLGSGAQDKELRVNIGKLDGELAGNGFIGDTCDQDFTVLAS